jgi:hypothetical protein
MVPTATIAIAIASTVVIICSASSPHPLTVGVGNSHIHFPWSRPTTTFQQTSSLLPSSSISSLSTTPRGGGVVATSKRPIQKGSASSSSASSSLKKGKMVKKVKKMVRKNPTTAASTPSNRSAPILPEDKSTSNNARQRQRGGGGDSKVITSGETMPSIFRIPSEEKYDRYAAALAITEGLRRVRDTEIALTEERGKSNRWGRKQTLTASTSSSSLEECANAKKRAESAFLLQSTKAVKSLGMTVAQFNQIGREVITDPALRERVSEQAYLYRVASVVNLDKVPLVLDDPTSQSSSEQKKQRVQLFARSVHEIEDLRSDQMEELRQSLQVERFPPGFDLTDPNVQPLLHPEVRRVCEMFPVKAEEIVKRYGLDSDEFNRMLEETRGNPIFRWRVQKYVEKAEEEKVKKTSTSQTP